MSEGICNIHRFLLNKAWNACPKVATHTIAGPAWLWLFFFVPQDINVLKPFQCYFKRRLLFWTCNVFAWNEMMHKLEVNWKVLEVPDKFKESNWIMYFLN